MIEDTRRGRVQITAERPGDAWQGAHDSGEAKRAYPPGENGLSSARLVVATSFVAFHDYVFARAGRRVMLFRVAGDLASDGALAARA